MVTGFEVGQRVQMHPATDLWMRGARFGNVAKLGHKYITVQLDALKKPVKVHPDNLMHVER